MLRGKPRPSRRKTLAPEPVLGNSQGMPSRAIRVEVTLNTPPARREGEKRRRAHENTGGVPAAELSHKGAVPFCGHHSLRLRQAGAGMKWVPHLDQGGRGAPIQLMAFTTLPDSTADRRPWNRRSEQAASISITRGARLDFLLD